MLEMAFEGRHIKKGQANVPTPTERFLHLFKQKSSAPENSDALDSWVCWGGMNTVFTIVLFLAAFRYKVGAAKA